MEAPQIDFESYSKKYLRRLSESFLSSQLKIIEKLADDLLVVWREQRQVFICGNGGSAANAIHMANDFHYGVGAGMQTGAIPGLRVDALPANTGILTCLANDTGYQNIYSQQLEVKARKEDLLIVLSGSGNSENVVNALQTSNKIGLKSYAIVAFSGGMCKELATHSIHFEINDMQIAEDTQLIIGHMCMQWLNANAKETKTHSN